MSPDDLAALVLQARTIAVVGLSPKPERPSNGVASYLQRKGYDIVPINPGHDRILGARCYPTLAAAAQDHQIDIVNVFRRSEMAGGVVDQAIVIQPRLIWLQEGVRDDAAATRAAAAGIPIVMDRCLAVERSLLEAR
jgi:predicted CoA-binding protein